MEIGGLMVYAFQTVFGNPDVITLISTFSIILTLILVAYKIYDDLM